MKSRYLTFQVYLAFARKSFQKQMQYRLLSTERLLTVDYAEIYPDISIPNAHVTFQEGARVQYRFSPEAISTADLIRAILQKFKIVDISVQEPDIEELIKTVYEDNLTLERKLAEPIPSNTGKLT